MSCGRPLSRDCSGCGRPLEAGARFCPACGTPALAPAPSGTAAATAGSASAPEERRDATILFADLAGFTAAAETIDPELLKNAMDTVLGRLAEVIRAHGGHVDKFIGDNVMGVFGAPVAHGDDPERAVRAGLAMQEAMELLNGRMPTGMPELALRVGINSGEVLAGRVGGDYTVIGSAVNLAARLEAACEPGTVLVGTSTRRRTGDAIEFEGLAPLTLRGLSEPVEAWRALAPGASPQAGLLSRPPHGPMIGRDAELAALREAIAAAAAAGLPQAVNVIGPAGVGKSRLLAELAADAGGPGASTSATVLVGRCPAYGYGTAYAPFRDIVARHFGLDPSDSGPKAWRRLLAGVTDTLGEEGADLEVSAEMLSARLAQALGIQQPDLDADPASDPEGDAGPARRRLFAGVTMLFEAMASAGPLVLGFEDAQWADEESLDLIKHLSRWARGPVVLVCLVREDSLTRDGARGMLSGHAVRTIPLGGLDDEHSRQLVARLLSEAELGAEPEVVEALAERSGGNPLFAEEMASRVREEGTSEVASLPDSVQALLAARLDSLTLSQRRLLQDAATIGERFWDGALRSLAGAGADAVDHLLEELCDAGLVSPEPDSRLAPDLEFSFRHALIQEVAYARMPKAERALRHADVAAYVEDRGGTALVSIAARHYALAHRSGLEGGLASGRLGELAEACLRTLETAGDHAGALHAYPEALEHYGSALEQGEPEQADRIRIGEKLGDAALRTGESDAALSAWNTVLDEILDAERDSPETEARLRRKLAAASWQRGRRDEALEQLRAGIDLLKRGEASIELIRLYGEAATLYLQGGENMLAIYAAEKALQLSEELHQPASAARAHGIFGSVFGRMGDAEKARLNLERAVEVARRSDPGEVIRALLQLGLHLEAAETSLDRAAEAFASALAEARRVGDVPAQIELHGSVGRLALRRGDFDAVEEATRAGAALAARQGVEEAACFSELTRGWLEWAAGEEIAESTLAAAVEHGRALGRSDVVFPALMLRGWAAGGRDAWEQADRCFEEALDVCERSGLIPQSVEATAARSVCLARSGAEPARASELAERAAAMCERFSCEPAEAAVAEARGAVDPDPREGARRLEQASAAWRGLERPLAALRARTLAGWRLAEADPEAGERTLTAVAEEARGLEVVPLVAEAERLTADQAVPSDEEIR